MLKTMLSVSENLDFVDEMFLMCPRWLHKDLQTNIRQRVGRLDSPGAREQLIDLLYSGVPYGWLWSEVDSQLDRDELDKELGHAELSLRSIFEAILVVHARMRGKSGHGAKFPVHYSQTQILLDWFPNCRLIHTTRDPRAVYASQSVKYLRDDQGVVSRSIDRSKQFVHINIQTTWTASVHRQLKDLPNYRLVRYEDVICDTRRVLEELCEFLEVPFSTEMLNPLQYGSSFSEFESKRGIDRSALDRWRTTIAPLTARSMELAHRGAFRDLGYLD